MGNLFVRESTSYDLALHAINGTPLRAIPSRADFLRSGLADIIFDVVKTDDRGGSKASAAECEYVVFENRNQADKIHIAVAVPYRGTVGPNNREVFWNGFDVTLSDGSITATGAYGTVAMAPLSSSHLQLLRAIAGL
jgi:hypothetical protein